MKIKLLLIFFLALAIPVACLSQEKKHNYKPKAGYVAKAETAKQIAVAVWSPIYGAKHIQEKKPFKARLQKGDLDCGGFPAGRMDRRRSSCRNRSK